MKFAFSKSTQVTSEWHELFSQFRTVGFEGLQLKSNQYRDYLGEPTRFLDDWGQYPGVASGLIVGGLLDNAGVAILRETIQFAAVIGAERIIYWPHTPCGNAAGTELREFAQLLSGLSVEAQNLGVRLSLHNHYNQIVMTREDLERFFALVGDCGIGLTVDTAHLVKSGIDDVAGVLRDFHQVIDNIHMKDYAAGTWKVLGEGDIDFAPIFAAIRQINYDGWVCADEESGSDLRSGMDACYRLLVSGLSTTCLSSSDAL